MDIIAVIVPYMTLLILFGSFLFGEYRYFRKDRPGYYQFALFVLAACAVSSTYDILTYFFFTDVWFGFSLSVLSRVGATLFSLGFTSEVFSSLKEQGTDRSVKTGFGPAASLAALIPVLIIIVFFIAAALIDPDPEDVIFTGIMTVLECFSVYPAALLAFRRKNDGPADRFRFVCFALVLFWIVSQILTYVMLAGGIAILALDLALAMSGVLLVVGLERGCGK